ncbi:substrate-binding periplasmic protein [Bifidobacterium tissieri]|uniref:Amino acid ABC transporter substrate-binding protein n=1 Tax=Bifidobacterium tissieri TaxID=1630162 RepID=A0A5M9ZYX0_9BIFI|nr:transporter substrate-binding domain-containing protein [Bifidobacterium tissieri]KAA8830482.1 amino acid ABC transporter substrate-binding protein [Bifidobacterium tissieri]KAA8832718.1 amino acid ABC transporter substrate-binding protein [Bifidobacterium tissieri]
MKISRGMKLMVAACAALMSVSALAACGSGSSGSSSSAKSDCTPLVSNITTIKSGTLTVGVIDQPPYSSYNGGNPEGMDIDFIKQIADANCLNVEWQQASFANAMQAIASGQIDTATGDINVTEKRAQVVDFPKSIYLEGVGYASKKDTDIKTLDDIDAKGIKTIGIGDGYGWLEDMKKVFGDKVKTYPSSVEMKQDLEAGRVDMIMEAYGTAVDEFKGNGDIVVEYANKNPDKRINSLVEPPEVSYPYTKGNSSLGQAFDKGIEKIIKDDKVKPTLKKYGLDEGLADIRDTQYVVPITK